MASIPPLIHNLDAALTSTWRPFRPISTIWTPPTPAHGVHSAPHPNSGRRPHQHMASIPPQISNLDATHISTWRPFRPPFQIWTPPTPAHGVHSALNPQSGRHPNSHMASIPPHIPNLDATHSSTWRPFLLTSQIWTPPHHHTGVHSDSHLKSGRRTDAAHSNTWRPFRLTSQIWTPHRRHLHLHHRSLQHMASIPPHTPNLDAALISTWRPFHRKSQIWTPHRRRTDAAQTPPGEHTFSKKSLYPTLKCTILFWY